MILQPCVWNQVVQKWGKKYTEYAVGENVLALGL